MEDDEKSTRFRITLQPELAAILEDVRKAMTVINPMRALAAMPAPIAAAVDAAADREARSMAADAGLSVT